jgi:hypothetical protein
MKLTKNNLKDVYRSKLCDVETMELKGYEFIENLFVDSLGFGQEDEPAMTISYFERRLIELINKYGVVYSAISSVGQFQVNVGIYKKGKRKAKKVANNTLRIETEKGYIIRLHDTNILEFDGKGYILDSGGFMTKTTKERLNEYLPEPFYISQKNFEWFITIGNDGEKIPFFDGIKLLNN